MKSQKKSISFSRRNFLKTSVLASGGMLIGFNFLNACRPNAIVPIDISKLNFNDLIAKLCAVSGSNLNINDLIFENII